MRLLPGRTGVFPAHAGMIPRLSSKTVGLPSPPRSCGVLLKTVWFMCGRLCVAMVCARWSFCTDGSRVSAGRWRTVESFEDNGSYSVSGIPRKVRGHGGAVRERGISSLKMCGANDLGNLFCRLADRRGPPAPGLRLASPTRIRASEVSPTAARTMSAAYRLPPSLAPCWRWSQRPVLALGRPLDRFR